MVSILPAQRSSWDVIGDLLGSNLQQSLPGAVQQGYNRGMLQKSLEEISNLSKQPNASNLDIMTKFLKATAGIPGSERYVGQVLPEILKQAESARSANYPIPGERGPRREALLPPMAQREPLPQFMGGKASPNESNFFPTNIGPQGAPGQVPQEATTGQKIPLRTKAERTDAAREQLAEMRKVDPTYNLRNAIDDINREEDEKKAWNTEVDKELEQRRISQTDYGEKAVEQLNKVYPDASPEIKAIFKKKGELAAKQGSSEADIERYLATEAKKIKNTISNVENDLSPARLQNILYRKLNGNYKDFNTAARDLRVKLQPLIDDGLYDTARTVLERLGYGAEEREIIINPLNEKSQSFINQLPNYKPVKTGVGQFGVKAIKPPTDINIVKEIIKEVKNNENNFSLVLGRKMFEDKGYDWQAYNQAIKDLIEQGELELTDDQRQQLTYLDSPPLHRLDQLLQGLNIIGR